MSDTERCYLCQADLSKDSDVDRQYHYCSPVGIIHFCSNCFDDSQAIIGKYGKISE